jgi:hypothetical protein
MTSSKMHALVFVGAVLVAWPGCRTAPSEDVGETKFSIVLPDSTTIDSIDWVLHSSTGSVVEMGSIDTSDAKTTASLAAVLPTGMGDTITMTGMTSAGVACTGTSSSFDVTAGGTATVSVNIICGNFTPDAGTGMLVVSSTVVSGDSCPVLTSSLISPLVTDIADPISVMATGSDADAGDTISFAWSATGGTFTSPTSASTSYQCPSTAGMQTLTLKISDNHMPESCTTVVTFPPVSCM